MVYYDDETLPSCISTFFWLDDDDIEMYQLFQHIFLAVSKFCPSVTWTVKNFGTNPHSSVSGRQDPPTLAFC